MIRYGKVYSADGRLVGEVFKVERATRKKDEHGVLRLVRVSRFVIVMWTGEKITKFKRKVDGKVKTFQWTFEVEECMREHNCRVVWE